jgi:uridine kinase
MPDRLVIGIAGVSGSEAIEVPNDDFERHRRAEQTTPTEPTPIIVVEGFLTFVDAALRDELDIRIYVDTAPDIRLMRRIRRDIEKRGRDFASVRRQYYDFVRPMHLEFVEPSKRHAHIIIPEGGDNEVAIGVILARLTAVL